MEQSGERPSTDELSLAMVSSMSDLEIMGLIEIRHDHQGITGLNPVCH